MSAGDVWTHLVSAGFFNLANRCVIAICLFTFLCPGSLWAATRGDISGRTVDPQGAAVPRARLKLINLADSSSRQATSDAQGNYEFKMVELGNYLLTAEAPGFAPVSKNVSVVSGQLNTVDLQFVQIASRKQEVTVVAEAPAAIDTKGSSVVTQYTQDDVVKQAGALDNLSGLLAHVSTAWTSQEHAHVRGAHQIGYLVNGIEVPDLSIFGAITPFIDPHNLKSVEVETGGLRAEYGNRTAAAVNTIARSGFDSGAHRGNFELEGGTLHRGSASVSYGQRAGQRFAYYTESRAFFSDRGFNPPPDFLDTADRNHNGVPDILDAPASQTVHNFRRTLSSFVNLDYRVTPKDTFNLVMGGYRTDLQIPNNFLQQQAGRDYVELERDHFQNLRYDHLFGVDQLLTLAGFHHFGRLETDGHADVPGNPLASDNRRANYYGGRGDYSFHKGKHDFRTGAEFYAAVLKDAFLLSPSPGNPRSLAASFLSNIPTTAYEESAYGQDQFSATDALTFNVGARFDLFRAIYHLHAEPEIQRSYGFLSPRFGLAYRIGHTNSVLFADFSYLFLPPPIEYFDLASARPAYLNIFPENFSFTPARPEHDVQYDIGAKFPFRGFSFRVNQWYKHQIHFLDHIQLSAIGAGLQLVNPNIFLPINQDGARTYGVEAFVRSPRNHGVSSFLNYAYNVAQGIGGIASGFNDGSPRLNRFFYVDHHQRNNAYLGVNYDVTEFHAFANAIISYGSGFPDASDNLLGHCITPRCQLPAHATLGLALGKIFVNRLDARLEIENTFDKVFPINLGSEFNGSHYSAPCTVTLRLAYLF